MSERETLLPELKTKHAVERNFEIIGEAASRVSEEFKLSNVGV